MTQSTGSSTSLYIKDALVKYAELTAQNPGTKYVIIHVGATTDNARFQVVEKVTGMMRFFHLEGHNRYAPKQADPEYVVKAIQAFYKRGQCDQKDVGSIKTALETLMGKNPTFKERLQKGLAIQDAVVTYSKLVSENPDKQYVIIRVGMKDNPRFEVVEKVTGPMRFLHLEGHKRYTPEQADAYFVGRAINKYLSECFSSNELNKLQPLDAGLRLLQSKDAFHGQIQPAKEFCLSQIKKQYPTDFAKMVPKLEILLDFDKRLDDASRNALNTILQGAEKRAEVAAKETAIKKCEARLVNSSNVPHVLLYEKDAARSFSELIALKNPDLLTPVTFYMGEKEIFALINHGGLIKHLNKAVNPNNDPSLSLVNDEAIKPRFQFDPATKRITIDFTQQVMKNGAVQGEIAAHIEIDYARRIEMSYKTVGLALHEKESVLNALHRMPSSRVPNGRALIGQTQIKIEKPASRGDDRYKFTIQFPSGLHGGETRTEYVRLSKLPKEVREIVKNSAI